MESFFLGFYFLFYFPFKNKNKISGDSNFFFKNQFLTNKKRVSPIEWGRTWKMRVHTLISFVFSGIVPGSPSHSGGSSASCPNPLFSSIVSSSFYLSRHRTRISFVFFGIVPESPIFRHWVRFLFIFLSITPRFPLFSPASCSNPLVIPAALRHRAWIPYFPTSCSVAFYLSRHRAWISFVFFGIVLVIRAQLVSQLIHVQLATWLRE